MLLVLTFQRVFVVYALHVRINRIKNQDCTTEKTHIYPLGLDIESTEHRSSL